MGENIFENVTMYNTIITFSKFMGFSKAVVIVANHKYKNKF